MGPQLHGGGAGMLTCGPHSDPALRIRTQNGRSSEGTWRPDRAELRAGRFPRTERDGSRAQSPRRWPLSVVGKEHPSSHEECSRDSGSADRRLRITASSAGIGTQLEKDEQTQRVGAGFLRPGPGEAESL